MKAQVAVVGGGPAGLTAAIALATAGVETALVAKLPAPADNRTTALLAGSVTALQTLGAWEKCTPHAAPLRVMRLVDDTGRLWRAPEVKFSADEIGLEQFGFNIENSRLAAALEAHARTLSNLRMIGAQAVAVEPGPDSVTITLDSGATIHALLAVGADGRRSLCRAAAGIEVETHDYPQHAMALCLRHTRPHRETSTEFHTPHGPFTLVPLPGQRSSLVWVGQPDEIERLSQLSDAALATEIERRSHSLLGKVEIDGPRGRFLLNRSAARQLATQRIALVGEAAHVIPPIGAQGLNLGLRDAAAIGEIVADASRHNEDIGSAAVLARYDTARRGDVSTRSFAVDLFNRSLLSDFVPVQGVRGLGLYLVDRIGPLRRMAMREGVAPSMSEPKLMRGELI